MNQIHPQHVLYLEDSATDADLALRALARTAPEVSVELVTTLAAALLRLDKEGPTIDVILSDLRLPDGSGLDLLATVRQRKLPVAVVILTGSGDQTSALAALKAGADDYLVKRGDYTAQLARVLSAALTRFRMTAARDARPLRVLYAEHNRFDTDLTLRHFADRAPLLQFDMVDTGDTVLARLPECGGAAGYDLLLLDYQLPGLNALEVAKILRDERGLDLPIVLVTGQGDEEVVAAALRMGIEDYVVKKEGYLVGLPTVIDNAFRLAQLRREQAALRQSTARLSHLLSASPTILYALRVDGEQLSPNWVSDNITRILGYSTSECLMPGWWMAHVHPRDQAQVLRDNARLMDEGGLSHSYRFLDSEGATRWLRDDMRLIRDALGQAVEVIGTWTDLTQEHEALERQRLQSTALESTRDAIMITDLGPKIISVNQAFSEITGYTADQAIGQNPKMIQSGRHDRNFYQAVWASLTQTGHWQGELWNRRANGEIYPQWASISTVRDDGGRPTHYVGVFTDLTQLRRSEAQLDRLAHYDPLTALPNRVLLDSLTQIRIEQAQGQATTLAVLVIDLDQFKTVNESLGQVFGDELLIAVANRLASRLRNDDTLGRLGADEFAVILEVGQEIAGAETLARDLLTTLDAPFTLSDGHEAYARASIGMGVFPQDATSAADLLRCANTAMHRAKENGGNQLAVYTDKLGRGARERLELETALRHAIAHGELVLHYQPKVGLASGAIVGAEALVRWLRPGIGLVSPAEFIPLAERTGLIVQIGSWVINEAIRQIRAWSDAGMAVVKVAVNVSARQFTAGNLEADLVSALKRHDVAPALIELEITESMLMAAPDDAIEKLAALKRVGVGISLDDFGTGYSSLAYLSRFPVDELKIDQSFIAGITSDPKAAGIATSVIALAHRMGLTVVAEGVETEAQLGYLRKNHCDLMQGYLFSRPVLAGAFETMVQAGQSLGADVEPGESRTLLVVDDEPNILAAIRRLLRSQGYQVLTAGSAREAMELLASKHVQVILSDQRMPEMCGTEFLQRVKQMHPDTVRIVISGYTELQSVIAAVNEGALYKFLTKPWDDDQLRRHVREAFEYYDAIIKPRSLAP